MSDRKKAFWFIALLSVLVVVPFLGETIFYSKGEPREAIVALSMLESGNWILPVNYGTDIADKTSFTLEVITDSIGFVGGVPVFEDRSSLGCSYRIDHATGKNRTVVHIHRDDISLQVSTRITHLSLAVKMGKATLRKYNGVIGFVGYGSIQCILLGRRSRYRILLQRIGRKPLSPLQGVSHLQTIPYLQRVCPLNIRRRDLRSTALRSSPTGEKKQDE